MGPRIGVRNQAVFETVGRMLGNVAMQCGNVHWNVGRLWGFLAFRAVQRHWTVVSKELSRRTVGGPREASRAVVLLSGGPRVVGGQCQPVPGGVSGQAPKGIGSGSG